MREIEDKYQRLAEAVMSGTITTIIKEDQKTITDMFAIWNIREHRRASPISDQKREGVVGHALGSSKDDQEYLEKHHIGVIRPNLSVSGWHLCGVNMQLNLFKVREQMAEAHWGILRATRGHFIVPDNFSQARILPLSPSICFVSQTDDHEIGENEVVSINRIAVAGSRSYYFAQSLGKCPR